MKIIIDNGSMVPIYEQIVEQVKGLILSGDLVENDSLPSIRTMAKDLKISALTVKKSYDTLEQDGFTKTVHGKGTFVQKPNPNFMKDKQMQEVEENLSKIIQKARRYKLSEEEIRQMIELILEEEYA